jgi:hypothetical protein
LSEYPAIATAVFLKMPKCPQTSRQWHCLCQQFRTIRNNIPSPNRFIRHPNVRGDVQRQTGKRLADNAIHGVVMLSQLSLSMQMVPDW